MKKYIFLFSSIIAFTACLNNDDFAPSYTYEYMSIDEAITPTSFTYGEVENITVKYTLPNGCYTFDELYYDHQGNERIVAVIAIKSLDDVCTQATITEEHTFQVQVTQSQDYTFKFWKGKDSQGNDIYDEVVIPVD